MDATQISVVMTVWNTLFAENPDMTREDLRTLVAAEASLRLGQGIFESDVLEAVELSRED